MRQILYVFQTGLNSYDLKLFFGALIQKYLELREFMCCDPTHGK